MIEKIISIAFAFFLIKSDSIEKWNVFEKNVRDLKIYKTEAKKQFSVLYKELLEFCATKSFLNNDNWVFPVEGASMNDVGKGGFLPKGYNFYDGNKHRGHAAYDIFIRDNNQDCLHDKTKKPVNIYAPVDLIILSHNFGWKEGSDIRGGNYIWAFNPKAALFFYFAHLDSIKVQNGDLCKKGTAIATLGRSGKNAFPKRSPTHLHFTVLKTDGENLIPYDYIGQLK
ncbi:MAG: hypothetical protein A2275_15355 [Bacteroidetes bacterium RIFOXYA12_FULL_35_11]|nr:MAG: hypothetical protein A2X01_14135 [Bacteroidetes bacterium GWF2_35_48]OFY73324.1 MAG: hypothetical protein A2275_15355 [Bacteroidetes bacterium RIFOXYA12_FULL_35_11]OFY93427.1 MAG: hypothetical protein A2309_10065 [Bacteroidetes bacterium RIFOXYB2_FULL_35_7]OFZ02272.1 MAG: hypothetical protein A2491_12575 [Bacteroidetes bacterium RIFOXYC12_FULL_35_7]HBX52277.1 hypothetical protein [Bacteroidales bacterium]